MQNQNKFGGNLQSFPSPHFQLNFCHCICVAIFIILESQSERLRHQNYKLRLQNLTAETNKFQLTNMLFVTF